MSIVKLASMPIVVLNNTSDSSGGSKTFSKKNLAAGIVGGTTGFGLSEAIQKIPKFNPENVYHRYGKRMGSVLGGFLGAAATYKALNKNQQKPNFYML